MTEYMGKKVNGFLLIMIIVVLLGMGGLSIYYQRTFKNVNSEYETVSSGLLSCQQNYSATALTLQNVKQNLNSTEGDIRKYDTLYEQKSAELEGIKDTLKTTTASLQKETLFKQQFQKKAEDYYAQVQTLNTEVTKLTNTVADKVDTINDLNKEISCLKTKSDAQEYTC